MSKKIIKKYQFHKYDYITELNAGFSLILCIYILKDEINDF